MNFLAQAAWSASLTSGIFGWAASACFGQSAPGFALSIYANVPGPVRIAFDPAGNLYCGRQIATDCLADPIARVYPGGVTFDDNYGLTGIPDPDSVAFDANGVISGIPGALVVGHGGCPNEHDDALVAIRPDRVVVPVYASQDVANPSDMVVDAQGHLIYTSDVGNTHHLMRYSLAEGLHRLAENVDVFTLAQDADGNLYSGTYNGGVVKKFSAAGALLIADYSGQVGAGAPVAVGHGGGFGTDLYVGRHTTLGSVSVGEIRRYTAPGVYSVIASGFTEIADLAFGPDGALYVSHRYPGVIYRIGCMNITQQPTGHLSSCPGSPVTLSVAVSGAGPFMYLWRKGGVPIDINANPSAATAALTLSCPQSSDSGLYDVLVTAACGTLLSSASSVTIIRQCGAADIGSGGGITAPCGDGLLDNNDFIAFVNEFFAGHSVADLGRQGGLAGSDGELDNNDFVAFITLFFAGC